MQIYDEKKYLNFLKREKIRLENIEIMNRKILKKDLIREKNLEKLRSKKLKEEQIKLQKIEQMKLKEEQKIKDENDRIQKVKKEQIEEQKILYQQQLIYKKELEKERTKHKIKFNRKQIKLEKQQLKDAIKLDKQRLKEELESNKKKKFKEYYLPSGNMILLRGYENVFLDIYFRNGGVESNIVFERNIKPIDYILDGIVHKYHPDFYLKKENKIIEVKSIHTFKMDMRKNLAKRKTCIENGFDFEFFIYKNENGNRVDFIDLLIGDVY